MKTGLTLGMNNPKVIIITWLNTGMIMSGCITWAGSEHIFLMISHSIWNKNAWFSPPQFKYGIRDEIIIKLEINRIWACLELLKKFMKPLPKYLVLIIRHQDAEYAVVYEWLEP